MQEPTRLIKNLQIKFGPLTGIGPHWYSQAYVIDVIIEKALTKDGEKMFNASDVLGFKKKADTNVIAEVATKIMGTGNPDLEDYKKN